MYVSSIRIQNYRCFRDTTVEFTEDLNIIIGENNRGKTNLLRALGLVFDRNASRHLGADDFCRDSTYSETPPEITITVTIRSSKSERPEDKAVVASWLTKLESPWEATLTFSFFLPEADANGFQEEMKTWADRPDRMEKYWETVDEYLPRYVARVYGGKPEARNRAEAEWLERFELRFLEAVRDVEAGMFSGRNPMLKRVLSHFLDHDTLDDAAERERRKGEFREYSRKLVSNIRKRIDLKKVLELARETGASIGGTPDVEGRVEESDLFGALRLVVGDGETHIPVTHNGLGYNNLIYMSLVLANLQVESSPALGENAKVFPMLLIEEPEAHLHPAMQYKFIRFLRTELKNKTMSRQVFVTTHSTHVTSAVPLDSLICMTSDADGTIRAAYPGRVFSDSPEDRRSKDYVQRYLDATKSNMLFCKGVILVEGMAELVLLPCLAECLGSPLEDAHVGIVRVDGVTFKHFLKLFGSGIDRERRAFALPSKVACIIDADPVRKKQGERSWTKCWPFEIGLDNEVYEYEPLSHFVSSLRRSSLSDNVRLFHSKPGKGKTFEYDLMYENPNCDFLITESCGGRGILQQMTSADALCPELLAEFDEDGRIWEALTKSSWTDDDKRRACIAACYLLSACEEKGEHAMRLAYALKERLGEGLEIGLIVPEHIKEAVRWVCNIEEKANDTE